jgi:hypothetical protein
MVMATGEEVAEFVSEENRQQRKREGESSGESERVTIGQRKGPDEFIPGDGFVVGIGDGEVRAGDEASAQRQQK